jgi:hypothetical protein
MHVTAVILERSLILDGESQSQVQQQLQEEYPARSAPRCAQRQIKLMFYFQQEKRIQRVLKDWGKMIWSTSNMSKDNEWAIAFSVFLIIILVTDKILGSAWYFCEANIQHEQIDAVWERRLFQDLVNATEKRSFTGSLRPEKGVRRPVIQFGITSRHSRANRNRYLLIPVLSILSGTYGRLSEIFSKSI